MMESTVFLSFNLYAWITIATVLLMFTVLLDYGPGGYRFSDFIRIGLLISSSWQPTSLS